MLCLCIGALLMTTSCLESNEDSTETYSDMAITSITLGTLNCYTQTTSSTTGNDTVIKSTLTGSSYDMTIDQLGKSIFNNDMLPAGTDLAHVLISSVTTKNNGIVMLKSMTSDSIKSLSTKDSIDFTSPRVLRVFASNLKSYRDYTMTLTIDPEAGVAFGWKRMSVSSELSGWTDSRLMPFADSVKLVDSNVITNGSKAYRLQGTNIESSEDLANWSTMGTANLNQLIGCGTNGLFAMDDEGDIVSSDNGSSWKKENIDDSKSLLPVSDIAMVAWDYAPLDSTDYLLMAGNDSKGQTQVWRKINEYRSNAKDGKWTYMPVDSINKFRLPKQQHLSLAYYNNIVLALGSSMTIYESRDQGITWKQSSTFALPNSLNGSLAVIANDKKGNLWIVTDAGEVWQGAMR